jgi:fructose-bisphosphate aldolase, class I
MPRAVQTIVAADPDAIQLTVGQARHLQQIPGKQKPSLVLRTDVANVYGKTLPEHVFSQLIADPVEQALQVDAACLVVNLFLLPDQAGLFHQCLANISALKPRCERYGMPLMVEPLVMQPNERAGGYMVDGDLGKILPLVRQAVELGADVIKADPCDDVAEYHRVVEMAGGVPVLVRGGGRAPDEEILARTHAVMQQGAAGIVYGRNVVQHAKPRNMTQALMSIVHHGATPEQAAKILREDRVSTTP